MLGGSVVFAHLLGTNKQTLPYSFIINIIQRRRTQILPPATISAHRSRANEHTWCAPASFLAATVLGPRRLQPGHKVRRDEGKEKGYSEERRGVVDAP